MLRMTMVILHFMMLVGELMREYTTVFLFYGNTMQYMYMSFKMIVNYYKTPISRQSWLLCSV